MRSVLLSATLLLSGLDPAIAADVFDRHTSDVLIAASEKSKPLARLGLDEAAQWKTLGPAVSSPAIVIRTTDGNWAKAIVGWGFRKGRDKPVPVLLIERYVTYRGDRGDTTVASGKDVMLFAGLSFNFDIGQVVPDGQGGDIRFTDKAEIETLDEAQMFALNGSLLPAAGADEEGTPNDHEGVLPRDFAGTWIVNIDGRWRGEWSLAVTESGRIGGTYLSDDTKSSYDMAGRIAALPHHVKLYVQLENAQQTIDAYLWTTDKSMMAGTATVAGRTFGLFAVRQDAAAKGRETSTP